MQSEQHFSRSHTLPQEKMALFVSSENLGALAPLPPPQGSYAPVSMCENF